MAAEDIKKVIHTAQHTQNLRIRYAAFLSEVSHLITNTVSDYPIDEILKKLDEVGCSSWANALGSTRLMAAKDVDVVRRDARHIAYLIESGNSSHSAIFSMAVAVEKDRVTHLFNKAIRKAMS